MRIVTVPVVIPVDRFSKAGGISANGDARLRAAADKINMALGFGASSGVEVRPVIVGTHQEVVEEYAGRLSSYCLSGPGFPHLKTVTCSGGRYVGESLAILVDSGMLDQLLAIADPGLRYLCPVPVAAHFQAYRRYAQVLAHYGYSNSYHLGVSESRQSAKDRWLNFFVGCDLFRKGLLRLPFR